MAMNDEETVALIAGGHTFGKTHGAADAGKYVGSEPEGASIEEQGLGWKNTYGNGNGADTITSGLEVTWTTTPVKWSNNFLENLFGYEWELTKSPAGANQWTPKNGAGAGTVPDAHDPSKKHAPVMLTTDLALKMDPIYAPIAKRFLRSSAGVRRRVRQGVVQADAPRHGTYRAVPRPAGAEGNAALAGSCSRSGSCVDRRAGRCRSEGQDSRVRTVHLRTGLDGLGVGVDVPRLRQARWRERRAHSPGAAEGLGSEPAGPTGEGAAEAGSDPKGVQRSQSGESNGKGKKVSLADLIVLGGDAAIEAAAKKAGHDVKIPFSPGRTDASQEQTDVHSFAPLEPVADGFRNYLRSGHPMAAEELLVDRAQLLTLTAPEMTVLVGGMRALNANFGQSKHGVFTNRPETLTNDFFVNLLDMNTKWQPSSSIRRRV